MSVYFNHQNKITTRRTAKAKQTPMGDKMLGFDKTLHSNIINQFHFPSNREHKEREVNKAKAIIP